MARRVVVQAVVVLLFCTHYLVAQEPAVRVEAALQAVGHLCSHEVSLTGPSLDVLGAHTTPSRLVNANNLLSDEPFMGLVMEARAALLEMVKPRRFPLTHVCRLVAAVLCGESVLGSAPDANTHKGNRLLLEVNRRVGDWRISHEMGRFLGVMFGRADLAKLTAVVRSMDFFEPGQTPVMFMSSPTDPASMASVRLRNLEMVRHGHTLFPILSPEFVDGLVSSLDDSVFVNRRDPSKWFTRGIHPEKAPVRGVYWLYSQDDALNSPYIQKLATDPAILATAQEYLGVVPILTKIDVWYSMASKDSSAADFQGWHVDYNCLKSIKLFVFLSNVTLLNGPHTFVANTHNDFGLLRKDSLRADVRDQKVSEDLVKEYYGEDRIVQLTGPRGTVLLEDTHGVHRGAKVVQGHRIMMQIEYAASLYGGKDRFARLYSPLGASVTLDADPVPPRLKRLEDAVPRFFQRVRMGRFDTPRRPSNATNTLWCDNIL